jgi:AcrR family transcriptional regulator
MQDETVRQKIVEAARERFAHYGYGKTTMAEVAGDCNMSPGNLYRYFPGKLDIAEVIARDLFEQTLNELRALARRSDLSAAERLKAVLHKLLEVTYHSAKDEPRLHAMVQEVMRERPDFARGYVDSHAAILAEILAAGKASGELAMADPGQSAKCLQVATAKFQYPPIWNETSLAELEDQLDRVAEAILAGLKIPGRAPAQSPVATRHA